MALLRKPQLYYVHDRGVRNDHTADAVFVGTGLFGYGGTSLSMQWVRPRGAAAYRKTTFSLAAGGEFMSLGFNYNAFNSDDDADLNRLTSWDVGLTLHPWRYLAIGAAAKNFDGPRLHTAAQAYPLPPSPVAVARQYDLGLAFRPFTDRVALAGDFLIDDQRGLPGSRLSFAALVEPLDGLVLSGGLAFGLHGNNDVVGQVAITLNGGPVGATVSGGAGGNGGSIAADWSSQIQLRVSMDRFRGLPIMRDRFLILDVPGLLANPNSGLTSIILPSTREPYLELLSLIDRARRDRDVGGVLVKVSALPDIGHARVEELRAALMDLRAHGKKVYALFMDGGDDEYLLATAAEKIWAVPQATFLVNGYTANATFLGGTLQKIGVSVDVARVGEYKTYPDTFTRTEMGPQEREMLDGWVDGLYRRTLATVTQSRALGDEAFKATLDQGILSANAAKAAGLVDEVVYPDELQGLLEKGYGHSVELVTEVPKDKDWPRRWGVRPKIAVINVEGMISEGKSRNDLLGLTRIAGAQSVLNGLQKAMMDPLTRAIVVRVDSTGGSGAASDLVWRAIRKVRDFKPVVASMGDYAASGGYYIAMGGERVFAEPSTLTGSIGVFALKPDLSGLLEKVGVNIQTLKRGDKADLFSLNHPWTEGEQQAMQRFVDEFYDQFITKVAESRKMEKAAVDAVGRGRIFSGEAAVKNGLVDELGGLDDAIAWAKERAGLKGSEVDVEIYKESQGLLDLPSSSETDAKAILARALGDAAAEVGVALEMPNGPLAMMPYRLRVK